MWDKNTQIQVLESEIIQKVGELDLEILDNKPVKVNPNRRSILVSCCVKNNPEKLTFRALYFKNEFAIHDFKKEVLFYRFLKQEKIETPFKVTSLLVDGTEPGFGWMVRQYIDGESLAGFDGAGFAEKFFTEANAFEIINNIKFIQSLTKKFSAFVEKNGVELPRRNYRWYTEDFEKNFPEYIKQLFNDSIRKYLSDEEREKFNRAFAANKGLLDNYCSYLAHGDMHPGNLFISGGKFLIIDWEEVHINNPMYDAAFIWIYGIQNEEWRSFFLEKFLESFDRDMRADFRTLFYLAVLRVIFRNIVYIEGGAAKGDKDKIDIRRRHLDTVKNIINNHLV